VIVGDARWEKAGGKRLAVELRILSRPRNRSNIDQLPDSKAVQELDKLQKGTRRVADREKGKGGGVFHECGSRQRESM
jgi:hypothetical protein